jgi:hypothetical protein
MRVGTCIPDDHLHGVTCTRCYIDTIDSLDHEHKVARNMYRIEINICKRNCASSWLFIRITLEICNIYCFSIAMVEAMVVIPTHLSDTFMHTLHVLFVYKY